jgi:4-hydroxy-4-methyl-2-oxoglutarate aldolase
MVIDTFKVFKGNAGRILTLVVMGWLTVAIPPAYSQIKQTREQVLFYTLDWNGQRFPDGRPKLPDDLLKRAVSVSIEDIWDFLREHGYQNQFEGNWQALHIDKPFAGRALTAQYMPLRPDMEKAIRAEGKREGRVGDTTAGRSPSCRREMST